MKDLYSIRRTQQVLGDLSRSKVEDLIKTGEITAIKIGSSVKVIPDSVDRYIDRLMAKAATTEPPTQGQPTTDNTDTPHHEGPQS